MNFKWVFFLSFFYELLLFYFLTKPFLPHIYLPKRNSSIFVFRLLHGVKSFMIHLFLIYKYIYLFIFQIYVFFDPGFLNLQPPTSFFFSMWFTVTRHEYVVFKWRSGELLYAVVIPTTLCKMFFYHIFFFNNQSINVRKITKIIG